MLKDDFFKVLEVETGEAFMKALLELNPMHKIFEGHFPGTPVVPGVCMMEMVKEMVEMKVGRSLILSKADSMKFLSVIDPLVDKVVNLEITFKGVDVNAALTAGDRTCFKFKGQLL